MKTSLNLAGIPTAERFIQSDGYVEVGGDDREGRVYRFKDTALARTYADLNARATSDHQREINGQQERALERYFVAYIEGGMMGNLPSVDLGNACFQGGAGRDHAAKSDWQIDRRNEFWSANQILSESQRTVLRVVVLTGQSLEDAGRALGKLSQRRAIQAARDILREAASGLVELWN